MNDQTASQDTSGRTLSVFAHGKDLPSLELAALDAARNFFGPDTHLAVRRNYNVGLDDGAPPDGRYAAMITVMEITP